MSCNYADGLSPYENKGIVGIPEKFDDIETIKEKSSKLADWILNSKHVVLHTGAGISTSAGIPDFRGPNGVWTLEKQGKKPDINISFQDAKPTKTHMAIKMLTEKSYAHYIISQNIDGLHLRTGIPRNKIAELHGNMFIEQCGFCDSQFVRNTPTSTVGKKCLEINCRRVVRGKTCRGKLYDTILDWEDDLPERDLELSDYHSGMAELNICLGTTLQILPSGNLPLKCKKYGGKVAIINLQPTKHDKKADLIINGYVDDVMVMIMKRLNLEIPEYNILIDPTKNLSNTNVWTIDKSHITTIKKLYNSQLQKKRKSKLKGDLSVKVLKKWDASDEKPAIEESKNLNCVVKLEKIDTIKDDFKIIN